MKRKWLKIGAGLGAGVVTLIGFFTILTVLYNFEIIDLTGDIECVGTFEDPCISHFDIKNPNPYVVDIYSKDQVKLDFSPGIYDYALFVPDKRCSATGSCRCELKDGRKIGFEDWRCVDFTNKTKPRKDKVYNFRFPAYSTTEFMLAGIKNNPSDKIKWGIGIEDKDYLDPVWLGVENRINMPPFTTTHFTGEYSYSATGNETNSEEVTFEKIENSSNVLCNVNFKKEKYEWTEITYDKDNKTIEKEVVYNVPSELSFYRGKELVKQTNLQRELIKSNPLSLNSDKFEENDTYTFSFILNPEEDFFGKIGDTSIKYFQNEDIFVNAILTNVTVDGNSSHLTMYDENYLTAQKGFSLTRQLSNSPFALDDDNSVASFDGENDYVSATITQDKNSTSFWYKNSTGSWTYITYNSTTYFVNGAVGTPDEYPLNISGNDVKFGVNGSVYFNGSIDNIKIFNRTLTSAEISNFNSGGRKNSTYLNSDEYLVAGWNFDDTTESQAVDLTGINNGTFTGGAGYSYDVLGLVGHWNFDADTSTKAYDFTTNDNDGVYTAGANSNTTGALYGKTAHFDGDDDYVDCGNDSSLNFGQRDFSIGVWVKTSASGIVQGCISKQAGGTYYILRVNSDNQLQVLINDGTGQTIVEGATNVNDGNWHHAVLVSDFDGNSQLYLDGNTDGSATPSLHVNGIDNTGPLRIGAYTPTLQLFNGSIDEVMIFNTALNQTEITAIYNNQSARFKSSGTQQIKAFNISSGHDTVNMSLTNYQRLFGSNISLRLGEWDVSRGYKDYDLGEHWAEFDGVNDYVIRNTQTFNDTQGTVCAWIKLKSTGTTMHAITSAEETPSSPYLFSALRIDGVTKKVGIYQRNSDTADHVEGETALQTGKWYHICTQSNGTAYKIYVDGINEELTIVTGLNNGDWFADTENRDNFVIGVLKRTSTTAYFNGTIDEVKIFNKALTQAEIYDLYELGRDIGYYDDTGLVSWWGFDKYKSSTTVEDKKGSNDGTFSGGVFINSTNNGLVSSWHLDEASWDGTSGEVKDAMGLNNGTGSGSVTTIAGGYYSRAGEFDGVDDYVEVADDDNLDFGTGDFSIGVWVKTGTQGYERIIDKRNESSGYTLNLDDAEKITLELNDGTGNQGFQSNTIINDDVWHHVVVIADRDGSATFYLDGVADGSSVISGKNGNLNSNSNLFIGVDAPNHASHYFNGSIDEVKIYNRSLSADEIKESYVKGRLKYELGSYQNLSAIDSYDNSSENQFSISTATKWLLPEFKLLAGTNQFYSPVVDGQGLSGILSASIEDAELNVSFGTNISSMIFSPLHLNDQDVWPENQTNSIAVFNITNVGGSTAKNIQIKLNDTKSGWRMQCNNATTEPWLRLNTTYQTIYSELLIDKSFQTWCRVDLNYPSEAWNAQVLFNITN